MLFDCFCFISTLEARHEMISDFHMDDLRPYAEWLRWRSVPTPRQFDDNDDGSVFVRKSLKFHTVICMFLKILHTLYCRQFFYWIHLYVRRLFFEAAEPVKKSEIHQVKQSGSTLKHPSVPVWTSSISGVSWFLKNLCHPLFSLVSPSFVSLFRSLAFLIGRRVLLRYWRKWYSNVRIA